MVLFGFLLLAYLVESMVEYFVPANGLKPYTKYIAAGVGVACSFGFNADVFRDIFGIIAIHPAIGVFATGLIIGRGSNYLNDLHDKFLS